MDPKTNGAMSAFPKDQHSAEGLTIREYMATHLLAGFLANPDEVGNVVTRAVEFADSLLAELAKS
jgi:hypothetical protein